ncbi:MAG TPA: low molecular weight protein tyrosine phosphatase family protein [Holophagaceae bacterium]|nr:low molecular weight protein tyrosine phosphatase family protein [Holophagaceae bacterium]
MKHLLFICSQNRLRSPTAEKIFYGRAGVEVASAGLSPDAVNPLSADLLEWADVVFVMEKAHRTKLSKKFRPFLTSQSVICLDIPDEYTYMEPALIELLESKVGPFLTRFRDHGF